MFDASYLVMGLGDVYLGAPVATPVDPRHRLVTTKYNPARTWTPPNVVGIGGAYMCIYGMEGPGGYQLFGRTIQVWNTYRQPDVFKDGKPHGDGEVNGAGEREASRRQRLHSWVWLTQLYCSVSCGHPRPNCSRSALCPRWKRPSPSTTESTIGSFGSPWSPGRR